MARTAALKSALERTPRSAYRTRVLAESNPVVAFPGLLTLNNTATTEAESFPVVFLALSSDTHTALQLTDMANQLFLVNRVAEAVPGGNYLQSPEYQQFEQAKRDFTNAVLRKVAARDLDEWVAEVSPAVETDRLGHLADLVAAADRAGKALLSSRLGLSHAAIEVGQDDTSVTPCVLAKRAAVSLTGCWAVASVAQPEPTVEIIRGDKRAHEVVR